MLLFNGKDDKVEPWFIASFIFVPLNCKMIGCGSGIRCRCGC